MRETPSRDEPVYSIVLAGRRRPPIWHTSTFLQAEPALSSLLGLASTKVAVRSVQAQANGASASLGRLTWSPHTHSRWLHESTDEGVPDSRTFCLTELWAPGWSQCEREIGAPFAFVAITNPFLSSPPHEAQFNQLVHVALPVALVLHHSASVHAALMDLAAAIDCAFSVYRVAPWWQNEQSVQDEITNRIAYVGMQHDIVPNLMRLRGSWQPFTGELVAPAA